LGKLNCISDHIQKYLDDAIAVAFHHQGAVRYGYLELNLSFIGLNLQFGNRIPDKRDQVVDLQFIFHNSRFGSGQIQEISDHGCELHAALKIQIEQPLLFVGERTGNSIKHELNGFAHGSKRRLQLM
jgi:hypothetical protein